MSVIYVSSEVISSGLLLSSGDSVVIYDGGITHGPHHPSVSADQSGGRGKMARMRRAMYRNPLVKKDIFDRASFFG